MVYSAYTKQKINKKKYKLPTITKLLFEREDIIVSQQCVACFLKIYKETGTIERRRGVLDTAVPSDCNGECCISKLVHHR